MSKTAIDASRSDIFNIRHDEKRVVIRMIEDPNHPEYDDRIHLPLREEFLTILKSEGMLQPAIGYKDGEEQGRQVVVLTVGRQRWKSIREIWRRMEENREDMRSAPAFKLLVTGAKSVYDRKKQRIVENCHRFNLSSIDLALEVRKHLEIVGEGDQAKDDARILFNFPSIAAMDNCLALLDATPQVQEQVRSGMLSPTAALHLSRQPTAVQEAVADRIEEIAAPQQDSEEDDSGIDSENEGDQESEDQTETTASQHPAPATEAPAKSRPVSVKEVKQLIRDETGGQSFNLVTLKQIEKELERKDKERERLMDSLEKSAHERFAGNYIHEKDLEKMIRIARAEAYMDALKWCRGESFDKGSTTDSGNSAFSAAFDALRDAIMGSDWMSNKAFKDAIASENDGSTADLWKEFKGLTISGEKIATCYRSLGMGASGLVLRTDSKWFQRIVDSYGDSRVLIREWGAHGWLVRAAGTDSTPVWKHRFEDLGRVGIKISDRKFAEWSKDFDWTKSYERPAGGNDRIDSEESADVELPQEEMDLEGSAVEA